MQHSLKRVCPILSQIDVVVVIIFFYLILINLYEVETMMIFTLQLRELNLREMK